MTKCGVALSKFNDFLIPEQFRWRNCSGGVGVFFEARSEEARQKIAAEARLAKSKSKASDCRCSWHGAHVAPVQVQELTRHLEDDEDGI
jgi:hypothetical protein